MLVDSHCHLDFNDFDDDFDEMILRAKSFPAENAACAGLYSFSNIGK